MSKPEVAIVGIGMHPFGRTPKASRPGAGRLCRARGPQRRRDRMVRRAVRLRRQRRRGCRRHHGLQARPDRPAVHQRRQRLRHRRLGAVQRLQHHRVGRLRPRDGRRLRQARAGRVPGQHPRRRPRRLVRQVRHGADHPVLRHEDQPLHGAVRHLALHPGEGLGQGVPQRRAQPQRLAAPADQRGADPRIRDAVVPADQVHVLLAGRGWRGAAAGQGRQGPPVHRHPDLPQRRRSAQPPMGLVRGHVAVDRRRRRPRSRPSTRPRPPSRWPAWVPRTSTSPSCRTPRPVPRSCTWPRTASASTASRNA